MASTVRKSSFFSLVVFPLDSMGFTILNKNYYLTCFFPLAFAFDSSTFTALSFFTLIFSFGLTSFEVLVFFISILSSLLISLTGLVFTFTSESSFLTPVFRLFELSIPLFFISRFPVWECLVDFGAVEWAWCSSRRFFLLEGVSEVTLRSNYWLRLLNLFLVNLLVDDTEWDSNLFISKSIFISFFFAIDEYFDVEIFLVGVLFNSQKVSYSSFTFLSDLLRQITFLES